MVDVVRTPTELLATLFADGQDAGSITPQDMRDLIVTFLAQSGWADYVDTEYTTGSPQSISANTDTILQNNAGTTRDQELPDDATGGFYNGTTDKIITPNAGDGYLITVEFNIRRASGSGTFNLVSFFDIGGAIPPLYQRTQSLPGNGDRKITFTTAVYTLDTWESNGADFVVNSSVATEIWGTRYVIHRLHRGFGTYPPA